MLDKRGEQMKFNCNKMREIRTKILNITQKDLADKVGVSYSYIQKLESGSRKKPSYETVTELAKALKVDARELFLSEE